MATFREWLGQIGLSHCSQALYDNGIDFDIAQDLTEADLRGIGLSLGDSRRLLHALTRLGRVAATGPADLSGLMTLDIASTAIPAPLREQRQLTVMFCDLKDSTQLAQQLDPEAFDSVIRAYRRACARVVAEYDGHVAQYLGDGLMVYFGWPGAHEDDAERCVRSALDIVEAVKSMGGAPTLAVHIGIATGLAVVGEPSRDGIGEDGLAVGETPSLAARLQGLAGTDEIVIGPNTRRLVGDTFELVDIGVHPLKGIVHPVRAWRVHSVRRTEGRFDSAHRGARLTPLVGRDSEVAQLLHHWQQARIGDGQVVVLSGEPGIGKSRLTQVLREQIRGEPHVALSYQCSPFRLNSALYPIIEQSEFAAGFAREDTVDQKLDKLEALLVGSLSRRAESAPLLAALLSLPTERYSPLGLSPRRQKEKVFEALVSQVEALSQLQPVLIVFEDLHWIDPTSQELLDRMVQHVRGRRVLLLLTYRPQYAPRGWEQPLVTTIALTGLPQHLGTELVSEVTGRKALPHEVLDQIVARADGVPLFIEELTKSVLESPVLREEGDRYTLVGPLPALAIPTTLNALLVERLGRRAGVRELAQIGACIGREFSHELLAAVSPRKGAEFEEELQQLIETGLVFRRGSPPDATYTFKHMLVQDAAYDSLLRSKRPQLHAQIAHALETMYRDRVANEPELLAHHHTQAEHLKEAVPLWRRAGEAALARVALQEAVAYLEKGLAIVERLEPSAGRDSLELGLREPLHAARLQWRGWATPEVGVNAEAILRLAKGQGSPRGLLIGLWGTWINTITQGRVAEARPWAQRLLDEGRQREDLDLRIMGHRASLSTHFYLGELHDAHEQGELALALYDESRASRWIEVVGNDVRTAVGVFTPQLLWMLGYPDRAAHVSDRKDADARRLGHPFDIGWALTWGSYVFDYRCEPERHLERIREAERHGREQSIPILSRALVPVGEGLAMLRMGHLPEAISLLRLGMAAWSATRGHLNVPYVKAAIAEAEARRGDVETGLGLIEECLAQIDRPGWHERVWLPEILRLKGWMLVRQGKLEEAEAELRASIHRAREQQARSWELRSSTTLAELFADTGRRGAAREWLAPVYGSFSEGLDTHDLRAARALLDACGDP